MLIETLTFEIFDQYPKLLAIFLINKLDKWWYGGDTNHGMNFKSRTEISMMMAISVYDDGMIMVRTIR